MDLDCDDSARSDIGIGFGIVDRFGSVKPQLDAIALGSDPIVIPLAQGFDGFFEGFFVGLG